MSDSIHIPFFSGKHFVSWKFRIMSILTGKGLRDIIQQDSPDVSSPNFKDWQKQDAQAQAVITSTIDDAHVGLVLTCQTSKQILNKLTDIYDGDNVRRKLESKNDLARLTMHPSETWQEYLDRAETLHPVTLALGAEVSDEELVISIVRGLPEKYHLIAMQFHRIHNLTISDIRRSFRMHEERENQTGTGETSTAYKTIQAGTRQVKLNKFRKTNIIQCEICGKYNHPTNNAGSIKRISTHWIHFVIKNLKII